VEQGSEMKLTVIICAHNPRPDYLGRVLNSLRTQTLPKQQWELFLIDNASRQRLSDLWDLTWHPHARHLHEAQLGKTPALLSGIREAEGNILVVVDDDNVLAPDYLMCALSKMSAYPNVGVWNGTVLPEFEKTPARWKKSFLPYLAINEEASDRISKDIESAPLPIGAGMVFCREVAREYADWMSSAARKRTIALNRKGGGLFAGEEDTELGLIAIKSGFACGRTPSLQLTHLMPRKRVSARYLFRIVRDISYAHILIYRWHGLRRGQINTRDFIRGLARNSLLVVAGAVGGNPDRFGRGMVGVSSLCGVGLAMRSKNFQTISTDGFA